MSDRVEAALAMTEYHARQVEVLNSEQRDLITAYRLNLALDGHLVGARN
jgi:hypothetical protein